MRDEILTLRSAPKSLHDLTVRTIQFRASSVDEAARSVEAIVATETPTAVMDFERYQIVDEVIEARGADLPEQCSLLDSHMRYSLDNVLGSVRDIRVDGENVVARLFFAEGDEASDKAWNKVRQGHLRDVSAGYRAEEYVDIPAGQKQTINGRAYQAGPKRPLRVTTKWTLREVSVVPIGADQFAKIRQESGLPSPMKENIHMLRAYLISLGMRADADDAEMQRFQAALTGDQLVRAQELQRGEAPAPVASTAPAAPVQSEAQRAAVAAPENVVSIDAARAAGLAEGQRLERERVAAIRAVAGDIIAPEVVERAIAENLDVQRAQALFLETLRARSAPAGTSHSFAIGHQRAANDVNRERALGLAFAHGAGVPLIPSGTLTDAQRADHQRHADAASEYAGISMADAIREAIRLRGGSHYPNTQRMLDDILAGRAAVSGMDVANIFSTSINLVIMAGYQEAPDTTQGWVSEANVRDFKTQERVGLGKDAGMKKLARGGTAKHGTLNDVLESYKISRYAEQIVIDEQDIIDDNQSALAVVPFEMGQAAARLRPDLVYSILLANAALSDTVALFHSTHANYGTTSTALAAATLQAGIVAMGKQTENGVNLNITPKFLIVPHDLLFTAEVLLQSAQRIISADSGGTYNPLQNMGIQVRSDNRIGVAGVTDPSTGTAYTGTATNWFLASAPGRTIEVGYLNGQRTPSLRSFVLDKGQWGIGYDIKMDIGAKAIGYRGLYKATGA